MMNFPSISFGLSETIMVEQNHRLDFKMSPNIWRLNFYKSNQIGTNKVIGISIHHFLLKSALCKIFVKDLTVVLNILRNYTMNGFQLDLNLYVQIYKSLKLREMRHRWLLKRWFSKSVNVMKENPTVNRLPRWKIGFLI